MVGWLWLPGDADEDGAGYVRLALEQVRVALVIALTLG